MKRIVLEWALLFSIGVMLAIVVLWADTKFFDPTVHHLRFPTTGRSEDDLHMFARDGDLAISNQFAIDGAGRAGPLVVNRRWMSPGSGHGGGLTVPGFDFQYYRFAPDRYLMWSLRITLLVPVALSFFLTVLIRLLGKRHRKRLERAPEVTSPASSEPLPGTPRVSSQT